MKEKGVFRTKLFGGFNKKDVFEYFENLQSQNKDENSDMIAQNQSLKSDLEQKGKKISELLDRNDVFSDKIVSLENKITELSDENEALKTENKQIKILEKSLFETNQALAESNDFKSRFEELSRKFLKMKSEMILKESQMQKAEAKYNNLKSAVSSLPSIDENLLNSAKGAVDTISQVVKASGELDSAAQLLKIEE